MVTLEFVPYREIEHLSSIGRIKKLLNIAKQNKIVLLEGRLKREEETELIKTTMEEIDEEFKGIELAVINPVNEGDDLFRKVKTNFLNLLAGQRLGLTIIGPASVVTEIKKDPSKIQLLTKEVGKIKGKKKKR